MSNEGLEREKNNIFPEEENKGGVFEKPKIVFGITWISWSWKSTFATHLAKVLMALVDDKTEQDSGVLDIKWDAAHRRERGHPMRERYTHYHPRANLLGKDIANLLKLKQWEPTRRRKYDHHKGVFTEPELIIPKPAILVDGLHTLYRPETRQIFDVTVFMAPEPQLGKYQKVRRDKTERWHEIPNILRQIERRLPDQKKFIEPQKTLADIIVSFEPKKPIRDEEITTPELPIELILKLHIKRDSREKDRLAPLVDLLKSETWLTVFFEYVNSSTNRDFIHIAWTVKNDELHAIAAKLMPEVGERLNHFPLEDGLNGVVQLAALYVANHKMKKQPQLITEL